MQKRNIHFLLLLAASLNLFTAFLHLIAGQGDLVVPMWSSDMGLAEQTQWLAAWHMITLFLFASAWVLGKAAIQQSVTPQLLSFLGWCYLLFSLSFIGSSLYMGEFAPQWVLLLPIGLLTLWGNKQGKSQEGILQKNKQQA